MHEYDRHRLDEIAAFLAVADHGGFARAAERLGRDASVISRRVMALEHRLGVRLLERTTRRVALTEAGVRFAERMRAAIAAMEEAEQEVVDAGTAPRGTLRVTAPATFGGRWIAPFLPHFLAAYPRVRVELVFTDRYVDLVAEGIDIAVRMGDLPERGVIARKLAIYRRLLCASPGYLKAHGTPRKPADLAARDCLLFTRMNDPRQWRFRRDGKTECVTVAGSLAADNLEALTGTALAGRGIVQTADWLVGPLLAAGRLVEVLPKWSLDGGGTIYLIRPSSGFAAAKIQAFADWLAARLNPPPWRRRLA